MMLTIALFAVTGFASLVAWVLGYAPLYVPVVIYLTLAVIVTAVLIWHVSESDCQKKYDVADCEWGRSPFVPATQEVEND